MRDYDAPLDSGEFQYLGVRDAIEARRKGALEINGWFTAQDSAAN